MRTPIRQFLDNIKKLPILLGDDPRGSGRHNQSTGLGLAIAQKNGQYGRVYIFPGILQLK